MSLQPLSSLATAPAANYSGYYDDEGAFCANDTAHGAASSQAQWAQNDAAAEDTGGETLAKCALAGVFVGTMFGAPSVGAAAGLALCSTAACGGNRWGESSRRNYDYSDYDRARQDYHESNRYPEPRDTPPPESSNRRVFDYYERSDRRR